MNVLYYIKLIGLAVAKTIVQQTVPALPNSCWSHETETLCANPSWSLRPQMAPPVQMRLFRVDFI